MLLIVARKIETGSVVGSGGKRASVREKREKVYTGINLLK
jgi:hypothetical protein